MKIYIHEFDRETNDVTYKVAEDSYIGDFSDKTLMVINIPSLRLPDTDFIPAFLNMLADSASVMIELNNKNEAFSEINKDLFESINGATYSITDEELKEYQSPGKDVDAARDAAWSPIEESFPVVNEAKMNELLSTNYRQVDTDVYKRMSDGAVVGIVITQLYHGDNGAIVFTEGNKILNDAKSFGIPLIGKNTGANIYGEPGPLTKEELTAWQETKGMIAIRGVSHDYVYSPMDVEMWANRQRVIINQERESAINMPVIYNGETWDCDEISRKNLAETLIVFDTESLPNDFAWRTSDNKNIPSDITYLKGLSLVFAAQKNAAFINSWTRKATLDSIVSGDLLTEEKITSIQDV